MGAAEAAAAAAPFSAAIAARGVRWARRPGECSIGTGAPSAREPRPTPAASTTTSAATSKRPSWPVVARTPAARSEVVAVEAVAALAEVAAVVAEDSAVEAVAAVEAEAAEDGPGRSEVASVSQRNVAPSACAAARSAAVAARGSTLPSSG